MIKKIGLSTLLLLFSSMSYGQDIEPAGFKDLLKHHTPPKTELAIRFTSKSISRFYPVGCLLQAREPLSWLDWKIVIKKFGGTNSEKFLLIQSKMKGRTQH